MAMIQQNTSLCGMGMRITSSVYFHLDDEATTAIIDDWKSLSWSIRSVRVVSQSL